MGAKLTRLQDTVNTTRQRVTSSLGKRTSCNAANGAAASDQDEEGCSAVGQQEGAGDGSVNGGGGVYCGNDDDFGGGGCGKNILEANNHETGHDPAIHGAKLEDRNYNNESFKKRSVDPSDPQQQEAAVSIQTQFRQHSAKAEVKAMREEDAATRIQAGFRGFIDREQVRTMKGDEPAPEQDKAAEEEVDIDLNDPEVEKAAIKIQAGFKGFKARKDVTGKDEEEPAESPRPASTQSDKQQKEEKVDIDLEDPEVALAALKIQAGFRGHQARQEVIAHKMTANNDQTTTPTTIPQAPSPATAANGVTTHSPPVPAKTQQQLQDEEDIAAINLGDPELKAAAMKIQAGFKGIKSRRKLESKKAEKASQRAASAEPQPEPETTAKTEEEEVDIDLNDPEVEKAAVKIQAGFKGLKTRKNLQQKSEAPAAAATEEAAPAEQAEAPKEEEVDIDLEDPATEKAALKIQASFRGFQTRRDMDEKKQEGDAEQKTDEPQAAEQTSTEAAPAAEQEAEKPAEGEAKKEEEEEVDIDLEDPEVEKAALKIQAGFKGLKARKELQDKKPGGEAGGSDVVDGALSQEQPEASAEEAPAKAEGEGQQEEVKASEEETQPKEVVESQQQEGGEEQAAAPAAAEGAEAEKAPEEDKGEKVKGQQAEEEEVDIDLKDPEVEKAALLIQSQFKGFKSKKFGKK